MAYQRFLSYLNPKHSVGDYFQYAVFPTSPPSKYRLVSSLLNFCDRTSFQCDLTVINYEERANIYFFNVKIIFLSLARTLEIFVK